MNLPQPLAIVKDHIRIGKGMELTNGVPEALEIVVGELEVTQRALNLACDMIAKDFGLKTKSFPAYFLAQAKGGSNETERTSETP